MKRREILKNKESEKQSINVDAVLKRDAANLKKQVSDIELELLSVEETITNYLSNEKLSIDSEFLALVKREQELKSDLSLIALITETYL